MKLILYSGPAALAGAAGAYHPQLIPLIAILLFLFLLRSSDIKSMMVIIFISTLFFLHTENHLHSLQTSIPSHIDKLSLKIQTPFQGKKNKRAVGLHEHEKMILIVPEQHLYLIEKIPLRSICEWEGELIKPSEAENFNAFDYRQYLYYQDIHWTFKTTGFSNCKIVNTSFLQSLREIRYQGIKRIEQIFHSDIHGIAGALLFGDRSNMDDDQVRMYQRLGVIHLLAISGMHVGMITLFLWLVLLRTGLTRETIRLTLFFILPFYAVMAGAAPPVLRAVGMVLLGLGLQYIFVRLPLLHILNTVFIIHLFLFPSELVNAGFQLSYAVSFALAISAGKVLRSPHKLVSLLLVTSVAQAGALPIIMWHFYEFSLSSFVVNLVYVPLFTLIILPALIVIYLISFLSMDVASGISMIPYFIIKSTESLSAFISNQKFSILITGKPSIVTVCMLILIIFLMMSLFERHKYHYAGCCLLMITLFLASLPYLNKEGSVTFINVGQGDSILIQLAYNQGNYLIDTGGQVNFGQAEDRDSVGENIVLPYIKSMGISTIDLLILTHHDWDHIGGTEALLKEVNIKEVWTSAGSTEKEEMKDLLSVFQHYTVPVKEITTSFDWTVGNNDFRLIVPGDHAEGNNGSLILTAGIGGKNWLFTGDIEEETEMMLMEEWEDIDVLKVAHHGSKSSTTEAFLKIVKPETAVISAGKNNHYGHPHPDVVERLKIMRSTVYSTSYHGAIRYSFIGEKGTFELASPYNIKK
ncbi:DNA internalization-related competence protein ComEC/Rec2 [Jeotgalibacillus salarius]|uniref:DNA internalization-related competence protein ComEC/Rec2 n=1 Tax=Jeotgalibacillus salarius TaxID=546023 RepID=A0A4Y8LED2_9BACL|nr:DNA internalization-related competence protein ComEC/Rec2 [Jeotgalibacillus salarius]TFE01091.1 DNA internalization-related competence protein ComEC/Rec2 [Jeotgalibacillus salarius]